MDILTAMLVFVVPLLVIMGILIVFGVIQLRNKQKSLPHPTHDPMFRPIGLDSQYSRYNPPLPIQTQGSTISQGFKGIGQDKTLVGVCFLTGEPIISCGCEDCQRKRRSI